MRVSWDPFHPDLTASATNIDVAQTEITTQHLVNIQHKDEWRKAQTMEVSAGGKQATPGYRNLKMLTPTLRERETTSRMD